MEARRQKKRKQDAKEKPNAQTQGETQGKRKADRGKSPKYQSYVIKNVGIGGGPAAPKKWKRTKSNGSTAPDNQTWPETGRNKKNRKAKASKTPKKNAEEQIIMRRKRWPAGRPKKTKDQTTRLQRKRNEPNGTRNTTKPTKTLAGNTPKHQTKKRRHLRPAGGH